jgi:hypothetical protein
VRHGGATPGATGSRTSGYADELRNAGLMRAFGGGRAAPSAATADVAALHRTHPWRDTATAGRPIAAIIRINATAPPAAPNAPMPTKPAARISKLPAAGPIATPTMKKPGAALTARPDLSRSTKHVIMSGAIMIIQNERPTTPNNSSRPFGPELVIFVYVKRAGTSIGSILRLRRLGTWVIGGQLGHANL